MEIVGDRIVPLSTAAAALEEGLRSTPVATGEDDRAAAEATCRELQRLVVRFGAQAGAASATGLAHTAEWLSANLEYLAQQHRALLPEERAHVFSWPNLVAEYLRGPAPLKAAAHRLVQFAELALWRLRPSPVGSANILARLQAYQSPERVAAAAPVTMPAVESGAPVVATAEPVVASADSAAPTVQPIAATKESAASNVDLGAPAAALVTPIPEPIALDTEPALAADPFAIPAHAVDPVAEADALAAEPMVAGAEEVAPVIADVMPGEPEYEESAPAFVDDTAAVDAFADATQSETTDIESTPADSLDDVLTTLVEAAGELASVAADQRAAALAQFRIRLLASVDATHRAGRGGLADACGVLLEYTAAASLAASIETPEAPDWVLAALDFAALAQSFAAAQDDAATAEALLFCLHHEGWPRALGDAELDALRAGLELPPETRADATPAATELSPAASAVDVLADELQLPAQQKIDPEHLALLAAEFPAMLVAMCSELHAAPGDANALEDCADVFERGANAVDAAGLVALKYVLGHVAQRVRAAGPALTDAQLAWLTDFPQRMRAYLAAPMDPSAAGALIESLFESGDWMVLPPAAAALLEHALHQVVLVADASAPTREKQATPQLVSLAIPPDINPELLDGLLSELPVQSADFAAAMQRVASGSASMFDLDVAKRAAHTLKGAANTVGVAGIANLTHHVEDILIALTKHGRMPWRELAETLIGAADCLEAMSEALLGAGPSPHDAQQTLQQVLDWANRIELEGLPASEPAAPAPRADEPISSASPRHDAAAAGTAHTQATPLQGTTPEATLRLPASLVDELLRLVGETMIANTQIKEQLRLTVDHTRAVTKQNTALQELAGELEQLVDVRGVTASSGNTRHDGDFDALEFDHFNELHTVTRRLMEAATDSRELSLASEQRLGTLADLLDGQGRLAIENQNVVMKTRMVPASSLVSRLQRSVRQTARLLDKRVELHVAGEHTAIDSQVLYGLVDPLMHLLRNAVDHGIEDGETRADRGKAAVGRIELVFAREGSSVLVRVTDDGGGLDIPGIRAKAERRGDLAAGHPASDDEIARFILLPGFSTRDDTTQISGRGIGMDAVYTRVQALKGTLRLHNLPARGLSVELRLPASLMTTHGLLVRQHDQVIAISSYGIHDIRYVTREQVRALGNGFVYQNEGKVYELDRLDLLTGRTPHSDDRDWFPALLVATDSGGLRAVRVQDVLDSQEIVVKNLGRYVPRPHGVVGVTILGDGSIAPVLDLPQLLRAPQRAAQVNAASFSNAALARSPVEGRRTALVVDDSLSARRAAAQFMRDAGYNVRTAIDGIEAAALVEKQVPDIILVDMEMPRMNGLEFTTHVRTREATRHVPIIMITSRSTEKHRRQAEGAGVNVYLTKPFSDDELLEHVERLTAAAAA